MRDTLRHLRSCLRPIYGDRETEAIIRIIFHHLKGWNLTDMLIHEPEPLSPFIKSEIDKILQRLLRHEPIQYITGEARFHGLELHVTPDVLIPRPETAELVDIIADDAKDRTDLKVLDIATGSGCIAIALARTIRFPRLTALDISAAAIKVAQENAHTLKTDISFICADIFKWSSNDQFDIIVSNPPYIDESEKASMEKNVLDYEPHSALFVADNDPLRFYKRIANLAEDLLVKGGRLYFEINPRHASDLSHLLKAQGYSDVEIIKDSFGKDRFIRATHP
ncbi:MAG: peptide chain release factor N(5)-glutamine methyltransferase [Muribaculaceae bacterium]|nr:peptide chain release factor N(5)-glutamine methyltransferase [Muribaculaceae bacterium]